MTTRRVGIDSRIKVGSLVTLTLEYTGGQDGMEWFGTVVEVKDDRHANAYILCGPDIGYDYSADRPMIVQPIRMIVKSFPFGIIELVE